jgi:hypothetical protein
MAWMPLTKPIAGLAGVEATFVAAQLPVKPSTHTTSVKVPPVSMPMRNRALPGVPTIAISYRFVSEFIIGGHASVCPTVLQDNAI